MRTCMLLLWGSILSGCGGNTLHLAEKVKYRLFFGEESAQISFVLSDPFQIKTVSEFPFDQIGKVFTRWDQSSLTSEIGCLLRTSPEIVASNYNRTAISKLPGNKKFPTPVKQNILYQIFWKTNDPSVSLFYNDTPQLVIGCSMQLNVIRSLPKNFMATQKFYSSNGDVSATISVLGPTTGFEGGVFLFGNFGVNPFKNSKQTQTEINHRTEWDLIATGPVRVFGGALNSELELRALLDTPLPLAGFAP